jgi:alpha-ketoglutarate-dependent taurine dioxygenase
VTVTSTPLGPTTGIEITGLRGHQLIDRAAADECRSALEQYGVVVYREVEVDDDDLLAFSGLLGDVVALPMGGHERPEIQKITRDASQSKLAAYREATFFWHIDGTTDEVPNKATLLTARQVSDDDTGDTEFANTYAAYDALPVAEKAALADVRVVHSFAAAQSRVSPDPSPEERAAWDRVPSREHPLTWIRQDGRTSMLIGATTDHVVGVPDDEGDALLDRLLDWATQPQFTVRHRWRRGDLVVWDNTGMLHRAQPYGETSKRLMHRTSLAGEEAIR